MKFNNPPFNPTCDHKGWVVPFVQEIYSIKETATIKTFGEKPKITNCDETRSVICSNCGSVWLVERALKPEGDIKPPELGREN